MAMNYRDKSDKDEAFPLWDQWPNENDNIFEAFREYLVIGEDRPTLARWAKSTGRSVASVHSWSSRWQWRRRFEAYDKSMADDEKKEKLRLWKGIRRNHYAAAKLLREVGHLEIVRLAKRIKKQQDEIASIEASGGKHDLSDKPLIGLKSAVTFITTGIKIENDLIKEETKFRRDIGLESDEEDYLDMSSLSPDEAVTYAELDSKARFGGIGNGDSISERDHLEAIELEVELSGTTVPSETNEEEA
jgi:hypothetical protein